ncbi:glycoside hydrolase family 6 protein [Streptomyces sp. OF3]|uniref:Glucanase n=1 Tax=Streptomyces alkaliterrae TaxID=2213162 RepID=A0A7W3WHZ3_9ACTN|nr:glycoside hydrolase family 6 protein [Streptomyces alkaliterrae]MBB1252722.1 glycoside hydrolase family 6 protein [Streptomyces alkaliterrae]
MYGSEAGRSNNTSRRAATLLSGVAVGSLLLTGCFSSGGDKDKPNGESRNNGPKQSDAPFWVNPEGLASEALARAEREGKKDEARLIRKIADRPAGEWIRPEQAEDQTRKITEAAAAAKTPPILVMYNIPHRDCGQYSKGGARSADEYRQFTDAVVRGIGDRAASVVIEPDALPHIMVPGCVPQHMHDEQYTLMKEAVDKLKSLPNTKVYLDAGNPHWIRDPGGMVTPLKRAGIDAADGFSLNVSNYQTTEENIEYGKRLSSMVGGKQFVIDTSRNGNGPMDGKEDEEAWCNPPGRALGEPPTTRTADKLVDAYMWIKRPGESDGACKGGPAAGQWHHEYALELARNAEKS